MPEVQIVKDGYKCYRCDHEWVPNGVNKPVVCAKCKSPYWDRERKVEKK